MFKIVFDTMRVLHFCKQHAPVRAVENMKGLGQERDGELIAGVLYEGWTGPGNAVWMHVAALPGRRWLTRDYLRYTMQYAYDELQVQTIFGWVEARNADARRFDEHIGCKVITTIPGAATDGGDVLIYAMKRSECRYV